MKKKNRSIKLFFFDIAIVLSLIMSIAIFPTIQGEISYQLSTINPHEVYVYTVMGSTSDGFNGYMHAYRCSQRPRTAVKRTLDEATKMNYRTCLYCYDDIYRAQDTQASLYSVGICLFIAAFSALILSILKTSCAINRLASITANSNDATKNDIPCIVASADNNESSND